MSSDENCTQNISPERKKEVEFYEELRKEYTIRYGTDVNIYGRTLLEKIYSDSTHFLYELIQNTEDACKRASKNDDRDDFYLNFRLFPDRLEVRHNGIPFDQDDIRGICGIVRGTKTGDFTQIGKFGIGFKSVYAYTRSPIVYSKNDNGDSFYFTIKDYIHSYPVEDNIPLEKNQTIIVIPFNHEIISAEIAFSEIAQRLRDLGKRTLLFLDKLEEISWSIDGIQGKYLKEVRIQDDLCWVNLAYEEEKVKNSTEKWLVVTKAIENNVDVQIAFKLDHENKIIPAPFSTLFVYFDTRKETHLNFLVHGPYQTTVGRDNIQRTEWNETLIESTASLLAESLDLIKEMGLLNVSFLETLPINYDFFIQETGINEISFFKIYHKIKKLLSGSVPYLPSYKGGFITAQEALLGRTEDLRVLLGEKQLEDLHNGTEYHWLDASITTARGPLRSYLMNILDIQEMTPDMFARRLSRKFLEIQSDEWMIRFYRFLNNHRALWSARSSTYQGTSGILRSKSIIRLENNTHVRPFNDRNEPNAYLPASRFEEMFPTVKAKLLRDSQAQRFLLSLGLIEPDRISSIKRLILPKYKKSNIIDIKENITDLKKILEALESTDVISDRKSLLDMIKNTSILLAINCEEKNEYQKPVDVYLGREYTQDPTLEILYSGNDDIWFLDSRYNREIDLAIFQILGCKNRIQIYHNKPNHQGFVYVSGGRYIQRGLNGFDPQFNIVGIKKVLKSITFTKSQIIWDILKKYTYTIAGTVETSTRQDFATPSKAHKLSKLAIELMGSAWVPTTDGDFKKPRQVSLSGLHKDFSPKSTESITIAKHLQFHNDLISDIEKIMPEENTEFLIEAVSWSEEEQELAKAAIEKHRFEKSRGALEPSEMQEQLIERITRKSTQEPWKDNDDWVWSGLSPEEEQQLKTRLGTEIPERYERLRITYQEQTSTRSIIHDTIDPKEFLLHEYRGACQICNDRIDIGKGKPPIIHDFKLIEVRNKNPAANMEFNNLGLCPNCWTRMKYGYSDLGNIFEEAKKVARDDRAPDSVTERKNDGYLVKITLCGEEKNLFYTQTHMQAVSNFLTSDFSN